MTALERKLEARFYKKKVSPGRSVQQFIADLDILLQAFHNFPTTSYRYRSTKKVNYGRIGKRLKHAFHLTKAVLRKTDKSKVFHLGRLDDYQVKSIEYMNRTQAYQCLGTEDPLPNLIVRNNKYLLDLR